MFGAGGACCGRLRERLGTPGSQLRCERAAGGELLIRGAFPPLAPGSWPAALRWLSTTLIALGGVWLVLLAQTLWHAVGLLGQLPEWIPAEPHTESAPAAPPAGPQQGPLQEPLRTASTSNAIAGPKPLLEPKQGGQVQEQSELAKPIDWPTPLRYQGAACKGLFVYVVSIVQGAPRGSAVSFATDAKSPAKYAHPGEKVGDWEVLSITDDWSGANPSVWLIHDGEVCRARLTGNPARIPPPPPPPPPRRRRRWRRR